MQRFSTALAAIAILAVLFLLVRLGKLEDELKAVKAHAVSPAPASARQGEEDDDEHEEAGEHGDVEVAHYMGRIQHYTQKLYWAGKAGNLTLAEFYRHEIDEDMEDIANAHIVDDGVKVSDNMEVYGIRAIDALKDSFKANGLKGFDSDYGTLIATCNSCHVASGHPELRMTVPTTNRYTDQDFSPTH